MTGVTNFAAKGFLNHLAGVQQIFPLPQVSLALFTAVGADDGTGFTEPVGNGYARVQITGTVATTLTTPPGNNVLTFFGTPAFVTAGMLISDLSIAGVIPAGTTVVSFTPTTVTMSGSATGSGVGDMDGICFTGFNLASGSAPSILSNLITITFPTPTGSGWGTIIAWGLFNESNVLMTWDYLGGFDWLPVEISNASPAVFTAKNHGYLAADNFVFSTEYGGVAPVLSAGSLSGLLTVQSPTTDTFTGKSGATAINTVTTGSGMVRKVVPQIVSAGTIISFAGGVPGGLVISMA